jgi:hypothetical protein
MEPKVEFRIITLKKWITESKVVSSELILHSHLLIAKIIIQDVMINKLSSYMCTRQK